MTLLIHSEWNETKLKDIAKATGVKQCVLDVSYARFSNHHRPERLYCEWIEDVAYCIATINNKSFHIIGMGTVPSMQGKGIAKFLLSRAIEVAKEKGLHKVDTRSTSGAEFYARQGFDVVGLRGGDYLLERSI